MDVSAFPTKGNLIKARSSLQLSIQGYEMLDKKRNMLINEVMSLIKRAEEIQSKIDMVFSDAYRALQRANISLGINTVRQIGVSIPEENNIRLEFRSVMGIEIPVITEEEKEPGTVGASYSLLRTNYFLDEAYINFNKVKKLILEMAEIENTIFRLANHIKKTQKRVNALQNIIIPRYKNLVNYIQSFLEEKEREEFVRLHVIKEKMTADI
ncbi:MAG: V-type ATP synthase subunit D [Firmicutes bacterium]|nr:V-type ATP synthase subunit D [Bacillota bacterium]